MQNPIPSPRRSDDFHPLPPLPRRHPLVGSACLVCDHPSCRACRAQRLPRLGGHRSEYDREHGQAAQIQARNRHVVIWWGEVTGSFWIATPAGLEEAPDVDTLLLKLWPRTDLPVVRHRTPLATASGSGVRIPMLA